MEAAAIAERVEEVSDGELGGRVLRADAGQSLP